MGWQPGLVWRLKLCDFSMMTLAELQHEIELLPIDQQNRVAAFLTALRMKREGAFSKIKERLADHSSGTWTDWEDAKAELGLDSDRQGE